MRLLRLKLNERFRSLPEGFEVHFLRNAEEQAQVFNPYCLVGRNGSGKSNVLEVLAAIFYHLECMGLDYKPLDFQVNEDDLANYEEKQGTAEEIDRPNGFYSNIAVVDAFELEYLFPEVHQVAFGPVSGGDTAYGNPETGEIFGTQETQFVQVIIKKEIGSSPTFEIIENAEQESRSRLSIKEAKKYLPKYILGYSSGENEILSLPFFKMRFIHFDEYADFLVRSLPYGGVPEGRLVFLDKQFSQAIVLCNFLLQDEAILAPFREEIGLEHIYEFRLIIRQDWYLDVDEEVLLSLSNTERKKEQNLRKELTELLSDTIEKLRKCSTAHFFDPETETLYLDYWVNEATQQAFRFHFDGALGLFQAFQILLTLNLNRIDREIKKEVYQSDNLYVSEAIPMSAEKDRVFAFGDFRIRKRGVSDLIYSKSLSDGEHQFLHTLGLCLLFKDEPCLFLLDEPETHLNPDWRSQFITRLRECFQQGTASTVVREILITSHSPFIISDSKQEYVLIFSKDEASGIVSYERPSFKTFGASVNQITIKLFDKPETIGGYAYQKLQELEERFKAGEDGMKIIKEANHLLGDSVEKIMFIDKILDQLDKE